MAAEKFLKLGAKDPEVYSALQVSAGAGSGGRIVALLDSGRLDLTMMPTGIGPDVYVFPASENLGSGEEINIWDDSGTLKVRKADATAAGKKSHGYVLAAVTSGNNATVYFGGINTSKSGLTPGSEYYLSTTAGAVTTTPASTVGNVVQHVGVALSATEMEYERGMAYEIKS